MTLIETLAVVAIVAVLASLLFPVFAQAKERGKQASCLSNLHQSHLAIKLYQADHDEKEVGSVAQMGLPPTPSSLRVILPAKLTNPGICSRVPSERIPQPRSYPYIYIPEDYPTPEESDWAKYVAHRRDAAILLMDVNHNLPSEPLESRFFVHTGLAVTYGGAALHRTRNGDPNDLYWWESPGDTKP